MVPIVLCCRSGWAERVGIDIDNGRIHSIESGSSPHSGAERHAIGVSGLPNVHSHAFQRVMAGHTEVRAATGDNFWSWRETMYRFVEAIYPDDMEAITAFAYMEMLEAGFTRVGEFHYLHHNRGGQPFDDLAEMANRVAAAAQTVGIGLTLLPVFYAHSGFGGASPDPRQMRFVTDIDGYASLLERSRQAVSPLDDALVGIAPHSLRACTAGGAHIGARPGRRWPSAHPPRRAGQGGGRLSELVRAAARDVAAGCVRRQSISGVSCTRRMSTLTSSDASPAVAPRLAFARSPKPTWATASSRPRNSWLFPVRTASDPIRTF